MKELDELNKELQIDEVHDYFSSEGMQSPTQLTKSNVTRWFSQMKMVESAFKNFGKLKILKCFFF